MKIEEKFMLDNFQHINELLIKIQDRIEIDKNLIKFKYNFMQFCLKIDKNADDKENTDKDMLNKQTDGLSFNHDIKYDERYAIWKIIIPNLENIKENHMHQYDNYDEDKFSFDSYVKYGKNKIYIYLQIHNLFNIPCYNDHSFKYDIYSDNNSKIKEIETEESLICLDKVGNLALSKLPFIKNLLLENTELKYEVDDLKTKIIEQAEEKVRLKKEQLRLKSEIEALEKEKLCKILTNKIYRVFGIKTMDKQD
jgi:hypothetical protein